MQRVYRSLTIVCAFWLLIWLWLSWPAMQDDAFIHLRYAVHLLQRHMISYNGVHADFGTSSLSYVWLLAGLRYFFISPVLPRATSSAFHVLLFGGLVWGFARSLRSAPKVAWGFALLLLAILVAPMAVRWLDDGMETSLSLCLVALTAFSVSRLGHSEHLSGHSMTWLVALGLFATLTRVEYLLLFAVASLLLFFTRRSLATAAAPRLRGAVTFRLVLQCATPLLGSLLASALIFFTMHSLVPDTAVAKAAGVGAWMGILQQIVSVLASALSFGALLLLFWLLTMSAVIAYERRISMPILLANSLFPITAVLAMLRGQEVQGIRYFSWTLLFPILWNILELRWSMSEPERSTSRLLRVATMGLAGVFLLLLPVESTLLYREFRARSQSLDEFRAQHLDRLSSLRLVAFDIGYIGYFTNSPVCDMAGLVNGRAVARLSYQNRVERCATQHPQYAYMRRTDLGTLNNSLDLRGWWICSIYDLANLRAPDPHYLIASPAVASEVCAAAGNSPVPLAPLLPPA